MISRERERGTAGCQALNYLNIIVHSYNFGVVMRINHKIGGVERTSKFDRSRYACGILIVIFRPQSNDKLKPPPFTLLHDASSMIN